jgi:hypothetical protein
METSSVATNETNVTNVTNETTRKISFFFRSVAIAILPDGKPQALPQGVRPETPTAKAVREANAASFDPSTFEAGGKSGLVGYRRKDIEVSVPTLDLTSPDAATLAFLQGLAEDYQAAQAKKAVDKFQPVANASLTLAALAATYAEAAAAGTGKPGQAGLPQVTDEQLAVCQTLFSTFYGAVAPKFAPAVAEVFSKRWSYSAVDKMLGNVTEQRLANVESRIAQFTQLIAGDAAYEAYREAVSASLALSAEMVKRYRAKRFTPVALADDDEM